MTKTQVTQDEFYRVIGQLDVEGRVIGRYTDDNYGTEFRDRRTHKIVGATLQVGPTPHYKPDCEYFLCVEG